MGETQPHAANDGPGSVPASATPAERAIIEILSATLGEMVILNARLLALLDDRLSR